ncbi:MAG TPA: bacterial transcriptional activator domain-containing protein [Candidatus Krumholzibacteria bacterium]|nr:bacterial transcriptional activator domain-containing protein [Candidatus Krumholzibacteria bacterium]
MLKRWIPALVLGLATVLVVTHSPGPAPAQNDSPTAVLTSCKGPVTIVRAGNGPVAATFGAALSEGDEVKTGADAEAEIMFASGNWVQVGANSSMKIKGQPGAKPKEQNFEVVQNFLKLKSTEGTSSISGLRSGDKKSDLRAVSPCQTKVRDARPTFTWTAEDPSLELQFVVYNETGIHWQSTVSGATSVAYPADAPSLVPGVSYSWTLETSDPLVSPPLRTAASFFEIIAPNDVTALDQDLASIEAKKPGATSYHLMRASLFFDRGLVADAIAETQAAVAADPDNASLHAILGRLYAETGRTDEAMKEMEKSR